MKTKTTLLSLLLVLIGLNLAIAQVGIGTTTPDASAALDVVATDKGLLPPRMTEAERDAISNPTVGLMLWCSNCGSNGEMQAYNGNGWMSMISGTANQPWTVPDAPLIAGVTPGVGQVEITFTAPTNNGGTPITSYTATSNPGGITASVQQAGGGTITVTGLTNGTAYTFTLTATNSIGTSAASAASNAVTPGNVPDTPNITNVTASNAQAEITFTAPANNGGTPITSYTATSNPEGITASVQQAGGGTITVTGLTNGTAYTFTLTATNSIGTSAASMPSNAVTPNLSVGDYHEGGVVFYIFDSNDPGYVAGETHGLVAAIEDQSSGAEWGCYNTSISGADGNGIGSGAANTSAILADCSESGIAAELCDNYTGGGYSDWFLPSIDELSLMSQNRTTINTTAVANGGTDVSGEYWSSTQQNAEFGYIRNLSGGGQSSNYKSYYKKVRAVRAF
ncbi:fibronectin type III domain-containing protein [Psychroflexus maritimus]|nr:fibronectin type III domain-containing protein [Psychroflexus maritimus]